MLNRMRKKQNKILKHFVKNVKNITPVCVRKNDYFHCFIG